MIPPDGFLDEVDNLHDRIEAEAREHRRAILTLTVVLVTLAAVVTAMAWTAM